MACSGACRVVSWRWEVTAIFPMNLCFGSQGFDRIFMRLIFELIALSGFWLQKTAHRIARFLAVAVAFCPPTPLLSVAPTPRPGATRFDPVGVGDFQVPLLDVENLG
jgi:hypothetical protein